MRGIAFSVKGLLAAVTLIAVGLFALLNASPLWVGIIVSLTVLLFLAALLALVCRPNPRRAFWAGFAFFGWGYLVLAYMPLGQSYNLFDAALKTLYKSVRERVEFDPLEDQNIPPSDIDTISDGEGGYHYFISRPDDLSFDRIGHCLWAWLLALIGGFLARHFYLAQERKSS